MNSLIQDQIKEMYDKFSDKANDFIIENYKNGITEEEICKASICRAFASDELSEKISKELTTSFLNDFDVLKKYQNDIDLLYGGGISHIMQLLLYSTLVESEKETLNSEKFYQNKIIDNFNNIEIFKNYIFIENEKKLNDGDKIDIFAKTKDNKRPIIIELKIKNKSGRKQLRSYATHFDNPILINISEEYPSNITEDIIYLTYKDLGI